MPLAVDKGNRRAAARGAAEAWIERTISGFVEELADVDDFETERPFKDRQFADQLAAIVGEAKFLVCLSVLRHGEDKATNDARPSPLVRQKSTGRGGANALRLACFCPGQFARVAPQAVLRRRHRTLDQITLSAVAGRVPQPIQLRLILDAFGDDVAAQVVTQ